MKNINKQKILDYMEKLEEPVFIDEIAQHIGVTWQTAKTVLLELSAEGLIKNKKHKGMWVFWK